jgi:uncharacterized protein YycO
MQLIFQKRPHNIFERLICLWTGGPYFHVGMLFEHGNVIEANDQQGVTQFALGRLLDPDRWTTVDIPLTDAQLEEVKSFLLGEMGSGYDWFGLWMAQVLGISRENKTKWFCSELAVATLKKIGLLEGAKPCRYSPNKLYKWASKYRQGLT